MVADQKGAFRAAHRFECCAKVLTSHAHDRLSSSDAPSRGRRHLGFCSWSRYGAIAWTPTLVFGWVPVAARSTVEIDQRAETLESAADDRTISGGRAYRADEGRGVPPTPSQTGSAADGAR